MPNVDVKAQQNEKKKCFYKHVLELHWATVRHRPEQNRVTWETPSSEAITLLQEPIGVLASYAAHAQTQVWSEQVWLNTTFISRGLAIMG